MEVFETSICEYPLVNVTKLNLQSNFVIAKK